MKYENNTSDGILEFVFAGDLIGENHGPELMEIAQNEIGNGIRLCMIDISEVRYINSSGIGVLITILTKFRNKDGEVILINPSEQVKKLLIITKLHAIFNIVDSREEAVQSLKQV
jgi:anti-sigma B factor antagonist